MPKLVLCSNNEWMRTHAPFDWSEIEDHNLTDAADDYIRRAYNQLDAAGFEVELATGQLATCNGWHGASANHQIGCVRSNDPLTPDDHDNIWDILEDVERGIIEKWAGVTS